MKVLNSPHISPFGGLNFVLEEFERLGVGAHLNDALPQLATQSAYSWKDTFYALSSIFFCGGDCIEDLSGNLKSALEEQPFFQAPSADTVLKRIKELSTEIALFKARRGNKEHQFCFNDQLLKVNLKLIKKHLSTSTEPVVFDYDNTLLHNNKADAQRTYSGGYGYCPGVGFIGKQVVYVENRNGSSTPHTLQEDTFERVFQLFKEENIKVDMVRVDSASYSLRTLSGLHKQGVKFYVRANINSLIARTIADLPEHAWEAVETKEGKVLRSSFPFTPFYEVARKHKEYDLLQEYRLVVTKVPNKQRQLDLFTNESCTYLAIITNDMDMGKDEVVDFYNGRGAIERQFDVLKNDFGWKKLPFSRLEQNLVYLILTGTIRNLYDQVINRFSVIYKGLKPTDRIKKFIFRFISIPAKWIRHAGQKVLRLYGKTELMT